MVRRGRTNLSFNVLSVELSRILIILAIRAMIEKSKKGKTGNQTTLRVTGSLIGIIASGQMRNGGRRINDQNRNRFFVL
jgi:hypothetical protein